MQYEDFSAEKISQLPDDDMFRVLNIIMANQLMQQSEAVITTKYLNNTELVIEQLERLGYSTVYNKEVKLLHIVWGGLC